MEPVLLLEYLEVYEWGSVEVLMFESVSVVIPDTIAQNYNLLRAVLL